jgi:hypothetical protein
MILSGYNKFIFSIFSESKDYLILTVFALKVGKSYLSFLQIQYTKIDSSGKPMPSFVFNTRLKVIDNSERDIIFSKGKIIFKDNAVKVEFASDLIMIYLNYTWDQAGTSPLKVLAIENKEISEALSKEISSHQIQVQNLSMLPEILIWLDQRKFLQG